MDANQLSQMLMQGAQGAASQNQLNQRAQIAKMLLQSGQNVSSPIVAALTGFLGVNELQSIADEQGKVDASAAQRQAAKDIYGINMEERKFGMEQQKFDEQTRQFNEQSKRQASQFSQSLNLERMKFNAEALRDAQRNAITKVEDTKRGVDLLFKGLAPMTDGLEKGMQWGIDKVGKRVAVPIATLPTEQGSQQKQLALESINRLLSNKDGVKRAFGAVDSITPNLRASTRDAVTDLNQLRAVLTVENLGLMKGVLTDRDVTLLTNIAAGGIADTASQQGALEALERMKLVFSEASFGSEQEAESAGLPKGSKILINGRMAVVE